MRIKLADSIVISIIISLLFVRCSGKTETLFSLVDASASNIQFSNDLDSTKAIRSLYFYFYNGGGVAIGDINNDSLPDIFFTANSRGNNKLYLNKGNFVFEDITSKASVAGNADWNTGVTMADVNGDGFLDIYVCSVNGIYNLKGKNELFINNNGNGTFTESAEKFGLDISAYCNQAAFFDYDHDGDLDCYLLNESFRPVETMGDTSRRRIPDASSGDRFFRNDISTSGKFTDISASAGIYQGNVGYGLGISVADINNDGWDDVYIGNDYQENDYYYINNGNGTFTESGAEHFNYYSRFSMGNDIADFNNDGQLDVFTTDMLPQDEKVLKTYSSGEAPDIYNFMVTRNGYQKQYSKNCLQINNGNGSSFKETSLLSGVSATDWSWCPLFADFDNDGNKDLFVSSGIVKRLADLDFIRYLKTLSSSPVESNKERYQRMMSEMPGGSSHSYIYKGDGKIYFSDKSKEWGLEPHKGFHNGAAYADLDNDGDLDLVVNLINARAELWRNNSNNKKFISVSFRGKLANGNGIGAKAYLFTKGKLQYQQLMLTRGFQSASDSRLHFGLDSNTLADSIVIVWPSQKKQTFKNVTAGTRFFAYERNANDSFVYENYFKPTNEYFESTFQPVNWTHHENDFTDFNVQYLIPHALSTKGPKIAVGDINNDGEDDLFICGAKGQPGALFHQRKGEFIPIDNHIFDKDKHCEDVDAVFFDANGDNYKDLFVVSGGNEYPDGDSVLADRLYINNGAGHFIKAEEAIPAILKNKSCVSVADIDKDGDEDVFVGTLANAKGYGISQTSHLLINNGKGKFSIAPTNIVNLQNIGMVTEALFADLNNDGYSDLLLAGEWMPLTIFINSNGTFLKKEIPASSGLWQTIFVDDVNKDGSLDILAGNWGWNNKYYSGKTPPLRMYVGDFDKAGSVKQLVSYNINSKEYPFLSKDEVEKPLPLLKKHYLLYSEYAGVPMKEVFRGWIDNIQPVIAERLGSVVCYGDGKGNFSIEDLPVDLQLAPIMSFNKTESGIYIAGGNFFDVMPYEGSYDSQPLSLFQISNNKSTTVLHQPSLSKIKGQIRYVETIMHKGEKIMVVARNNKSLLFLKTKPNPVNSQK